MKSRRSFELRPVAGAKAAYMLFLHDPIFGIITVLFSGENAVFNAWTTASRFMKPEEVITVKRDDSGRVQIVFQ